MSKADTAHRISHLTAQLADTERALAQELDRLNRVRGLVVRWRNNGAISYASQLQGALDDKVIFTDPLVPKRVPGGLTAEAMIAQIFRISAAVTDRLEHDAMSVAEREAWKAIASTLSMFVAAFMRAECGHPYPCDHAPDGGNHPVAN